MGPPRLRDRAAQEGGPRQIGEAAGDVEQAGTTATDHGLTAGRGRKLCLIFFNRLDIFFCKIEQMQS